MVTYEKLNGISYINECVSYRRPRSHDLARHMTYVTHACVCVCADVCRRNHITHTSTIALFTL